MEWVLADAPRARPPTAVCDQDPGLRAAPAKVEGVATGDRDASRAPAAQTSAYFINGVPPEDGRKGRNFVPTTAPIELRRAVDVVERDADAVRDAVGILFGKEHSADAESRIIPERVDHRVECVRRKLYVGVELRDDIPLDGQPAKCPLERVQFGCSREPVAASRVRRALEDANAGALSSKSARDLDRTIR